MRDISGYFDWAATTPVEQDILEESTKIALEEYANPSSIHQWGKTAREKLEKARMRSANVLGVPASTLYFTSGGTESNHIPIMSLLKKPLAASIAVSEIEHPAVREMAECLKSLGWKIIPIKSDRRGLVSPEAVRGAVEPDTALVCVMAVNNETGAVQPVCRIAETLTIGARGKKRPRFHVDCVQAAGKIPFDLAFPGIDSAAFSAHKIGGPRGIGLLYLAKPVEPFARGGGQEGGIRSGTENLAGAWAFSRCLERFYLGKNAEQDNSAAWNRYLCQQEYTRQFIKALGTLKSCMIIPQTRAMFPQERQAQILFPEYSPWIVQVSFASIPGEVMVRALDDLGFAISTGSACSLHGGAAKKGRSILAAMGVDAGTAQNAVRFSFGSGTTKEGMDALFEAIKSITDKYSSAGPARYTQSAG
ncbi:MAG: cysteine desulfurase [Treponema sp.]|jgi:cysteine desulfurase|nr:cysteine desulfurase [Treponema sp.]